MLGNRLMNDWPRHHPSTYADSGDGCQRPWKTPPVAMEHRQCPKIARLTGHLPASDIAHRVEVGPSVVVDHAFGITGCARGVVQADGVPFISRQCPVEVMASRL